MATSSPSIDFSHTTDAQFRVWGQAISTALQAVGLVLTADTGQINWTTVLRPSNGTYAGYEMYRFNDALQATKPVYLKVEYGTAGISSTSPALRIQIGLGTNGAGTLTILTTTQQVSTNTAPTTGGVPCYFSGDGSYVNVCLSGSPTFNAGAWHMFSIDRTRNIDGTANGDGLVHWAAPSNNPVATVYFVTIDFTAMSATSASAANVSCVPAPPGFASGVYQSNTYVFPVQVAIPKGEAPMKSTVAFFRGDLAQGTVFTATHLGATHTFIAMWLISTFMPSGANSFSPAFLWE